MDERLVALDVDHHRDAVGESRRDLGDPVGAGGWSVRVRSTVPPAAATAAAIRSSSVATRTSQNAPEARQASKHVDHQRPPGEQGQRLARGSGSMPSGRG